MQTTTTSQTTTEQPTTTVATTTTETPKSASYTTKIDSVWVDIKQHQHLIETLQLAWALANNPSIKKRNIDITIDHVEFAYGIGQ